MSKLVGGKRVAAGQDGLRAGAQDERVAAVFAAGEADERTPGQRYDLGLQVGAGVGAVDVPQHEPRVGLDAGQVQQGQDAGVGGGRVGLLAHAILS